MSFAIGKSGRRAHKGKRRKHGCDTIHDMHEWTKANKSARRWYHGYWLEQTQEPYARSVVDDAGDF